MLHPILETLFFLKVARESVCDSIKESDVKDKAALIGYIQNEASDYEIMHLLTIGEMPEQKFDAYSESVVWDIFKEAVIMNTETLKKECRQSDIMNIVYEMGPVSTLGYSSAAPILEFDRANGRLDIGYLTEERGSKPFDSDEVTREKNRAKMKAATPSGSQRGGVKQKGFTMNNPKSQGSQGYDNELAGIDKSPTRQKVEELPGKAVAAVKAGATAVRNRYVNAPDNTDDSNTSAGTLRGRQIGKDAAVAAVGVAGLYGLYKLYKGWKAKKAAAKTAEAKQAAEAGMAKVKAKIAAKKKKK